MATVYYDSPAVPADKDGHNDNHAHVDSLWSYQRTFIILMVLLIITYLAYFLPFDQMKAFGVNLGFINTIIALTIAMVKTLFVVLIFMHLRHSTKLTWVIASAGFVWLCVMVLFTFADYLSRGAIRENVKLPLDGKETVTLMPEPGKAVDNAHRGGMGW